MGLRDKSISTSGYLAASFAAIKFFGRNLLSASEIALRACGDFAIKFFIANIRTIGMLVALGLLLSNDTINLLYPFVYAAQVSAFKFDKYFAVGMFQYHAPVAAMFFYAVKKALVRLGILFEDHDHELKPDPVWENQEYLNELTSSLQYSKDNLITQCTEAYDSAVDQMQARLNTLDSSIQTTVDKVTQTVTPYVENTRKLLFGDRTVTTATHSTGPTIHAHRIPSHNSLDGIEMSPTLSHDDLGAEVGSPSPTLSITTT